MNRIDRNFCMLDGERCTRCNKCTHIQTNNSGHGLRKFILAMILALVFIILLSPVLFAGMDVAHDLIKRTTHNDDTSPSYYQKYEEPNYNYNTSPSHYQEYKGPVPYYDTGFYVYTYEDNPATCGGGQCPTSEFAYC